MTIYLPVIYSSGAVLASLAYSAFYVKRHRTNIIYQMSSKRVYGLIILAWVASFAALPLLIWDALDSCLGDGGRIPWNHPIGELLLLITGPVFAIAVMFRIVTRSNITFGKCAAMLIPVVLSSAELFWSVFLWWTQYR